MLTLFTDGSAVGRNPGKGGSGFVIMRDGNLLESLGFPLGKRATNNAGELMAVACGMKAALSYLDKGEDLLIVSDSEIVTKGLAKADKFAASQRPNREIWQQLHGLLLTCGINGTKVQTYWVRGHSKIPGNILCDHLARSAAERQVVTVAQQKVKRKKDDKR